LMGIVGTRPKQIAHKRALAAKALADHEAPEKVAPEKIAEPAKA